MTPEETKVLSACKSKVINAFTFGGLAAGVVTWTGLFFFSVNIEHVVKFKEVNAFAMALVFTKLVLVDILGMNNFNYMLVKHQFYLSMQTAEVRNPLWFGFAERNAGSKVL